MPAKWTENQQKAIDIRNTNTLVSAAAGSGKTAVLVERVIQRITDPKQPVPIDRLLIVTFTNAAAAEMRERIYDALIQEIDRQPENAGLKQQLTLLGQAQITTVHSFCQNLIRSNFHRLGISSDFEIADQATLAKFMQDAMQEILEEQYAARPEGFRQLIDNFGGKKDDSRLIETIEKLYFFSQSTPAPKQWIADAIERYTFQGEDVNRYVTDVWGGYLMPWAKRKVRGMVEEYDRALEIIKQHEEITVYYEPFLLERNVLADLAEVFDSTWVEVQYILCGDIFMPRLPSRPRGTDDTYAKIVQEIRKDTKAVFQSLQEIFSILPETICQENQQLVVVVKALCRLVISFMDRYAAKKRDKNLLDFNDLEHFAIELLSDEAFASEIREKFDEVLVDEYQDTNGVQAKIFETVSNGNNLFMVGDVKQSIYSFRNARPDSFIEKFGLYAEEGNTYGTKLVLSHNFRSSQGIIAFVNRIFRQIMSSYVGDVEYTDEQELQYGNTNMEDWDVPAEVHIIESKEDEDSALSEEQLQYGQIEREAIFTAKRIIQLVQQEKPLVYDKAIGGKRPLQYRDIAVLSRKTSGVASIFAEQFSLAGIPVYTEQTEGYFTTIEIATVIAFLKVIDNPLQDIPLLAVLRSPMFGFTDNELAEIRSVDKRCLFYEALQKAQSEKAQAFLAALAGYQETAKVESIAFLIRKILSDTGYFSFVGTLPGGGERMANLRLLSQRAEAFEAGESKSIFSFINYLRFVEESGQEYTTAKMTGENDDVVTVMSTHKSKGLEFPVVFLVRAGGRFNKTDVAQPVLYDISLGIGIDYIDTAKGYKYPSIPKAAIAEKKKAELLSEEMRILYVALTRAREKLVIVGSAADAKKKIKQWSESCLVQYQVSRHNSFLEWIVMALQQPDFIQVHKTESIFSKKSTVKSGKTSKQRKNQPELYDAVNQRLSYRYDYAYTRDIPAKLSVSEIVGGQQRDFALHRLQLNQDVSDMSAAARGTVIHFVLQNIDLSKVQSIEAIQNQLNFMEERGMLASQQKAVVDIDALYGFFSSDLGQRMLASSDIRREYKFLVDMPSGLVLGDTVPENDETVVLQGVIDCCFIEGGEFVIIDYKTGSLREEYQKQLKLYALCLEKATGKKVKETCIYPLI